ncbi:meiotic nuclear division protein 1 [Polychytrium aggregatum]|uniref:meiotic nuclear division protein 1 n=1 Tax=Polychytrium aggregatum TaxID=110093 RepID=UPI0022FDB87E|nr:meiotic nuclear division protein 1 [Polychytrium aggregatum]KAI9208970.1 meiotic nuclear division protein 1 [Polychytrium aggregatum]
MSGKKRGLSMEEKRTKLMEIFFETKDFWQLKELEKMAPKMKGIVTQSVKEVLDGLVSDAMVNTEKIGTSNYFWAFPSAGLQTRKRILDDLTSEHASLEKKKKELDSQIEAARSGREDSDERDEMLKEIQQLEREQAAYKDELQKFKDCDPAVLREQEKYTNQARLAANRWTENIFALQSYCAQNFNISSQQFYESFDLPQDFDTL